MQFWSLIFDTFSVAFGVTLAMVAFVTAAAPNNPAQRIIYPERKPQVHKSLLHSLPAGYICDVLGIRVVPVCSQRTLEAVSGTAPCTTGLLTSILWQRKERSSMISSLVLAPMGQSSISPCQLLYLLVMRKAPWLLSVVPGLQIRHS